MIDATENPRFQEFMKLVDKHRTLGVRTNADTPEDAKVARGFGAEGIGLFRTEHMFYGKGSDEPLFLLRKMIMVWQKPSRRRGRGAEEAAERGGRGRAVPLRQARHQGHAGGDGGLPVTIRLLDPPLHEFVPQDKAAQAELAKALGIRPADIQQARRGAARDQPHDGPPRRPPGHHLSRGDRDAGPGDLRGRRRADPGRQGRPARRSWSRSPATSRSWT